MSSAKQGQDFGGKYKYYGIEDYDTCCTCEHFSDNGHEERFECLRNTERCNKEHHIPQVKTVKSGGYIGDEKTSVTMSCTKEEIEDLEELGRLRRKERPLEITEIHLDEYRCPACGAENGCNDGIVADNYCPECGQRIFQKMEAKGLEPLASR